jgi:hypothetical protein
MLLSSAMRISRTNVASRKFPGPSICRFLRSQQGERAGGCGGRQLQSRDQRTDIPYYR